MTVLKEPDSQTKDNSVKEYSIRYQVTTQHSVLAPRANTLPLALITKPDIFYGYMNGYRQPVARINLRILDLTKYTLQQLELALQHYLKKYDCHISLQSSADIASGFAKAICTLQQAIGLPIFEKAEIENDATQKNEFIIWIPMLFEVCLQPIILFIIQFFNYHLIQSTFKTSENIHHELNQLINSLKIHAPRGSNSLRFLKAAWENNIPWRHFANNTFQYGYGKHSCWLDSTFTDKTAHISSTLIQNKKTIAYILAQAGFPVAESYIVSNETEATAIANKINYPVVIKPVDGRGGAGVYTNLRSVESLQNAFNATKKNTQSVLLEKHILGKDYRLLVFNGKLIWAIERIPASITGDGTNTIKTLIENHNQIHQARYPLNYIQITADTLACLAEQGFTLDKILNRGEMAVLSQIANISAGGTPVGVFDKVHPDNQWLAETVAKHLRLDLIGIDFISADIQKSYREIGGTIIEVNIQPQLGSITAPHLYKQILSVLTQDQGRIPIIIVFGNYAKHQNFIIHLQNQLFHQFSRVGVAKNNVIHINNQEIMDMPSLFIAGQHLLSTPDIDALVYCVNDFEDIKKQGLPFDRYNDLIFLHEVENNHVNDLNKLNTLLKACKGKVIFTKTTDHPINKFLNDNANLKLKTNFISDLLNYHFINLNVGHCLPSG